MRMRFSLCRVDPKFNMAGVFIRPEGESKEGRGGKETGNEGR